MSLMKDQQYPDVLQEDAWAKLKTFTDARIALGRVGCSVPTTPLLQFQLAHAQAKDAVLQPLDVVGLTAQLQQHHADILHIESCATDKALYLKRPDLGRCLSDASRQYLHDYQKQHPQAKDVVIVVGDGLSARAIEENAPALIQSFLQVFTEQDWSIAPLVIATGSRVALGDEVAEILQADLLVMLIGERPGLSSPDSLGVYYTWQAKQGCHDAMRNCISNVRPAGLSVQVATQRLLALMQKSKQRGLSGVNLKDEHALTEQLQNHAQKRLF